MYNEFLRKFNAGNSLFLIVRCLFLPSEVERYFANVFRFCRKRSSRA